MKLSEDMMRQFVARHGQPFERRCDCCSTIVTHPAVNAEKTKDKAVITYAPCPGKEHGASTYIPLSAKEKAHWSDLFWGLRGAMEGYDPAFNSPQIADLPGEQVVHLGDDEPFAVLFLGVCSFPSILAVANKDWDVDEPPFCEEACRYVFVLEQKDGTWRTHVDPTTPGAVLATVAFWEEPWRRQEAV